MGIFSFFSKQKPDYEAVRKLYPDQQPVRNTLNVDVSRNTASGRGSGDGLYTVRFDLDDIPGIRPVKGGGTHYLEAMITHYRGSIIEARVVTRFDVRTKPHDWTFLEDKAFVVDADGVLLASIDMERLDQAKEYRYPVFVGDRVLAHVLPRNRDSSSGHDVIVYPLTKESADLAPYAGRQMLSIKVGTHAWLRGKGESGVLRDCSVTMLDTGARKTKKISVDAPDGPIFTMTSQSGEKFEALKKFVGPASRIFYEPDRNVWNYYVGILK